MKSKARTYGTNTENMRMVEPTEAWNFGLVINRQNMTEGFELVRESEVPDYFWTEEDVPVKLKASGVLVPNWTEYNTAAGPMPPSPLRLPDATMHDIILIPYGATTLRVTTFPEVLR